MGKRVYEGDESGQYNNEFEKILSLWLFTLFLNCRISPIDFRMPDTIGEALTNEYLIQEYGNFTVLKDTTWHGVETGYTYHQVVLDPFFHSGNIMLSLTEILPYSHLYSLGIEFKEKESRCDYDTTTNQHLVHKFVTNVANVTRGYLGNDTRGLSVYQAMLTYVYNNICDTDGVYDTFGPGRSRGQDFDVDHAFFVNRRLKEKTTL